MANGFKHKSMGSALTQAEYEEESTGHIFDSQATGDVAYASSSTIVRRLGIGSTGNVLTVVGGIPAWEDLGTRAHTFTANQSFNDGVEIIFGGVTSLFHDTSDANANIMKLEFPAAGGVDVPVVAIGIGIDGVDLTWFNGETEPQFAAVSANRAGAISFGILTEAIGHIQRYGNMDRLHMGQLGMTALKYLFLVDSGSPSDPGVNCLTLGNGTDPSTQDTDTCSLFAKDVSTSSELFAQDESETEAQLTPHPEDYLETLPLTGREFPWAEHSLNPYLGLELHVDMMGAIRAIERLSGETFINLTSITKRNWPRVSKGRAAPKWMTDRGVEEEAT